MVDVAHKPDLLRRATATGIIHLQPTTIRLLRRNALPKGDVLTVAKIAGIQAAKRTAELIPLCHPLPLHQVELTFQIKAKAVHLSATAVTIGKTGIEMEALTAVSVAALTLYDMCKAVDKKMVIGPIQLVSKSKTPLK